MTFNRLAMIGLVFAVAATPGCRRTATDEVAYKDEIPPPAEPLIKQLASVGRYGGRFVLGQTNNPKTFNGMMATETSSSDITNLADASLVRYDNGTQQFEPELAKSWDVAPDGVTWTFHLRKGAAFSDGHPMTAEDVLFSFQVAYDKNVHPAIQDLLKIGGEEFKVSAPDPYTIVINTLKPNAALLDALCQGGLSIIPKHVLEQPFKDGTFAAAYNVATPPDRLVFGGAWRVVQYVPGEKVVTSRLDQLHVTVDRLVDLEQRVDADGTGARERHAVPGPDPDFQIGSGLRLLVQHLQQLMPGHNRLGMRGERIRRLPAGSLHSRSRLAVRGLAVDRLRGSLRRLLGRLHGDPGGNRIASSAFQPAQVVRTITAES